MLMIANPVDNRLCAELFQLLTRELPAFIAARDVMANGTIQKSVIRAAFAALPHEVRKATMTFLGKRGARPAKQAAYRRTPLVRNSFRSRPSHFNLPSEYTTARLLFQSVAGELKSAPRRQRKVESDRGDSRLQMFMRETPEKRPLTGGRPLF